MRESEIQTTEFVPIFGTATLLFLIAIVFLVWTEHPAHSAESSSNPVPPQTEKIVVAKAFDLLNALNIVTGNHDVVVGEGDKAKVVPSPYSFDDPKDKPGDTFWALTDDIAALRKVVEKAQAEIRRINQEAVARNGGEALKPEREAVHDAAGNITVPEMPSKAQLDVQSKIQALMDSEVQVDKLFRVKRSALKIGENRYVGSVIASLRPVIDDK